MEPLGRGPPQVEPRGRGRVDMKGISDAAFHGLDRADPVVPGGMEHDPVTFVFGLLVNEAELHCGGGDVRVIRREVVTEASCPGTVECDVLETERLADFGAGQAELARPEKEEEGDDAEVLYRPPLVGWTLAWWGQTA